MVKDHPDYKRPIRVIKRNTVPVIYPSAKRASYDIGVSDYIIIRHARSGTKHMAGYWFSFYDIPKLQED